MAATAFAALTTVALAQGALTSAGKPSDPSLRGDDTAMTDVDPPVLTRCQREASRKNFKGSDRETFMDACVESDD